MATETGERLLYMVDSPPITFYRWPEVLKELKINVLSWLLSVDYPLESYYWPGDEEPQELLQPLTRAGNRELTILAENIFYTTNEFNIDVSPDNDYSVEILTNGWPPLHRSHLVRRLRICVEVCTIPDTLYDSLTEEDTAEENPDSEEADNRDAREPGFEGSNDTERAKRGPDTAPDTAWQKGFTNLRELHADFHVRGTHDTQQSPAEDGQCCSGPQLLARLQKLLARTEMDLKSHYVKLRFDIQFANGLCSGHTDILDDLKQSTTKQKTGIEEQESSVDTGQDNTADPQSSLHPEQEMKPGDL